MRVLTLGAGTVGHWIAELLCGKRHDVTVIDIDPERVRQINSELDVQAIQGNAAHSAVLFQANAAGADICLAVTGNDEANILAASMAKAMGVRRSIARTYSPVYHDSSTFDYQRHYGIDSLLSLEHLSALELVRSIRNPEAIPLEHFARGMLEVYDTEVSPQCSSVGQRLREIQLPAGVRIGSIEREDEVWLASGEDEIQAGDHISLIGIPAEVTKARSRFHTASKRSKRQNVLIAGGGQTGLHVARSLPHGEFRITLLERNRKRCEMLSKLLPDVTVVHANANRRSVLEDEGGGATDYFVACTGQDENNIMAGVEARELGARRVLGVVGRPDYANVVGKLGIDQVVSERDVAARQILGFMNDGAVISYRPMPKGKIGIYELEVFPDSRVTSATLTDLPLAGRCLITAIESNGFVRGPKANDQLRAGDIVVALIDHESRDECVALFKNL
ncbi:MAG: Trk system potassium transport protein TrkA [Rhodopirellula sp. TMED11]|nr:MAG: Trk system potassium transport protein TrkA [Rhodopirellula sp. TMED11]